MIDQKIVILIAVRLKSVRLKEKAMLNLFDKPLILKLVDRMKQSKLARDVILCTSTNSHDDQIEILAKKNNIEIFRGDELDVMSRFITVGIKKKARIIIRVTGDNPLTDFELMDQMIYDHIENNAEYTFTESVPHGTRSEVINLDTLIRCHDLIQDKSATEFMTWMLNRPDYFRVNNYVSDNNINRPDISLTVDTKNDYKLVSQIFNHFKGKPPNLKKIIEYYDSMSERYKRKISDKHLIDSKYKINTKFISDE
tara:strand:- start:1372 stop:2133 length:762 start_codon:yes stop_codon:yes gene_type:complete